MHKKNKTQGSEDPRALIGDLRHRAPINPQEVERGLVFDGDTLFTTGQILNQTSKTVTPSYPQGRVFAAFEPVVYNVYEVGKSGKSLVNEMNLRISQPC